uniref:vacuolar protein-sorting-associated protein 36-like n=1 Tax=Styela clava TaxID=7725 RepID=UPI00193A2BA2|nr:vacuolar protein-sorting-associated protein 36-like [Styela clava]
MDRWSWDSSHDSSQILTRQNGIKLYDGDDGTSFEDGILQLTPTKIIWTDSRNQNCNLLLSLSLIVQVEKTSGGIGKAPKLVLHLSRPDANKPPGPVAHSRNNFIRIGFKNHGDSEFYSAMMNALKNREWEKRPQQTSTQGGARPQNQGGRIKGGGIVGIERKIEQRHKEAEKNISVAFQDLTKLMDKAKEMVQLSQAISSKIKDKQGDISEDETIKFKSYLLSLGIPNPVTKETHGTGTHYHMQLARELSDSLVPELRKRDGIILLSDAYCMINRARGLEMLSPDDMINACKMFESMKLPVRMKTYDSGVSVIQLETHSEEKSVTQTVALVTDSESLTAQQLANLIEISVFLAKERLILAEKLGKLCRDDSVEGLRFFVNRFV